MKKNKIVLIDDQEESVAELIKEMQKSNMEVIFFNNPNTALENIKSRDDIKLFIVDFYMPGIDGINVAEKIRNIEAYKNTTIFILTSEKSSMAKNLADNSKVTAWLVKPCNPKNLVEVINKIKVS